MRLHTTIAVFLGAASIAAAQRPTFAPAVRAYITVDTPTVVITHVRVVDGTGAPAREDQAVVFTNGRITYVGPTPSTPNAEPRTLVVDGTGKTVMPGLVMVHEHLFYPPSVVVPTPTYVEHAYSFPRLYLGAGITTARTGGSMEPYADISIKKWIDAGTIPGPRLDVTGPYLSGPGLPLAQFHELADSADARRTVAYWASLGATSFKAYMHITRAEMKAAIDEAHKHGLKVTGHICSVTFREAAELGIDNLEHGLVVASDFAEGKQPDQCPANQQASIAALDPATNAAVAQLIKTMVDHKVALTSTLAVFETFVPGRPATPQRVLDAMSTDARLRFLQTRAASAVATASPWTKLFKGEMTFEKMFVDAGGLLLVGTDPTGYGGAPAGYGSQRAVELLVEAGFTPLEAIKIATMNGATYLGRSAQAGSVAVGKDADLLLVAGNPSQNIADLERIEIVFKGGVGYDSARLLASAKGLVGSQ